MLTFYTWPRPVCLTITIFFALCVLFQTLSMVLSFYRWPKSRKFTFEALLELLLTVQVFTCSLMHGQAIQGFIFSMPPATGYGTPRYIVFAVIVLLTVITTLSNRKPQTLVVVAAAFVTLPLMERLTGAVFAYFLVAALLFWLIRSTMISLRRYREIRTGLSALSVNNAIDSLHTGVLFGELDGYILLSNSQMQRLMAAITGEVRQNAVKFYDLLSSGDIEPDHKKTEIEGQIVILFPDQAAWMFTKTELHIERKKYLQLTATDITERWALTAQLSRQKDELMQKSDELYDVIANLSEISSETITQRIKMRVHDIISEQYTMLTSILRDGRDLEYAQLQALSRGLVEIFNTDQAAPDPQDELARLQREFGSIGVTIRIDGSLPEDTEIARLFAEVIREGVTNAVRHGFATETYASIVEGYNVCSLRITDNGQPSSETITEGGGISGIRKKAELCGGLVTVMTYPHFALTVDLPGGTVGV